MSETAAPSVVARVGVTPDEWIRFQLRAVSLRMKPPALLAQLVRQELDQPMPGKKGAK